MTDTTTNPHQSTPRVAIVTGGSGGIGRAVARRLAADGCPVVVGYGANTERAHEITGEIEADGGRAIAVSADIADPDQVAALFDTAERTFGGTDIVVNTAGRLTLSPLAELDLDRFDALYRTNVRGTVVVDQQAARRLRPGGAIVNFSSSIVGLQTPTYGSYAATKGAVEALTMVLARELRGRDVTVNVVSPGPTATPLFFDGKDEATIDRLARQPPLERLGRPDDIAGAVAFLVSPAGHWINGQNLRVNGGIV